jgi:hypothetical protein
MSAEVISTRFYQPANPTESHPDPRPLPLDEHDPRNQDATDAFRFARSIFTSIQIDGEPADWNSLDMLVGSAFISAGGDDRIGLIVIGDSSRIEKGEVTITQKVYPSRTHVVNSHNSAVIETPDIWVVMSNSTGLAQASRERWIQLQDINENTGTLEKTEKLLVITPEGDVLHSQTTHTYDPKYMVVFEPGMTGVYETNEGYYIKREIGGFIVVEPHKNPPYDASESPEEDD